MNLSVIIPSKTEANLVPCVAAIRKHEPTVKIIVVNDNLDLQRIARGDQCWCCTNDPLRVVEGVQPFIFARNINIGIRAAGTDDVCLMNDDALLETSGGLSKLQHQALVHPECGLISAATNGGAACQRKQQGERLRYDDVMVAFVCVFIPRATIDKHGLLDERFGVNAGGPGARGYGTEDDDYCWRLRAAGLKLGIYDGCFVDHRSLVSTFRGDPEHPADVTMHERVFAQKWGRSPRNP
jgi:glycosyltransferase involved in cell wall biosynthesis